jgi:hypothetical protein
MDEPATQVLEVLRMASHIALARMSRDCSLTSDRGISSMGSSHGYRGSSSNGLPTAPRLWFMFSTKRSCAPFRSARPNLPFSELRGPGSSKCRLYRKGPRSRALLQSTFP